MDLRERGGDGARRHPWEVARARFLLDTGLARASIEAPIEVLDVGSGDAWLAERFAERLPSGSRIVAWDTNYTAEDLARPGGRVELRRERPEGRFDLLLLLDVLEHVEDDAGFLASLVADSLAPDGWALITVPAWPILFSRHDTALHHFRRYRPEAAEALVRGSGLEIVASGGLFHGLMVPRLLRRLREELGRAGEPPNVSTWRHGAALSWLIERGLTMDRRISTLADRLRVDVPGTSWWALCRVR